MIKYIVLNGKTIEKYDEENYYKKCCSGFKPGDRVIMYENNEYVGDMFVEENGIISFHVKDKFGMEYLKRGLYASRYVENGNS